jgi:hypothetical protein
MKRPHFQGLKCPEEIFDISNLENKMTTLPSNVVIQSPKDAESYPRRKELKAIYLQKPQNSTLFSTIK